jgi:lysophospholipase L1-like esterase
MRCCTRATQLLTAAGLLGAALLATTVGAAGEKKNPAATPSPRMDKGGKPNAGWLKRHEGFVEIAKKGDVNVLFLGDSITDAWRGKAAKPAWDKHFAPLKAANFGIGGDRTEHVLWRISNGELEGIKPKVIVLMIGTNNTGSNSADQIAEGIKAIVDKLGELSPSSRVLLLGVFPRGEKAGTPVRAKIAEINKQIAKLGDNKRVYYQDIGARFLKEEDALTRDIMPDFLHLSAEGYRIWGEAIDPAVKQLLGKPSP